MTTVLVTGGAGYIGSITTRVLKDAGYYPVVFDNFEFGKRGAVKDVDVIEGDLRNYDDIDAAIKKVKPTAVIHFAAYLSVGESVAEPIKYFENNVYGTLNLCKAMVAHGVKNLVFSSTCSTYGQPEKLPVTEQEKEKPESPYGESKLMVEKMLQWFHKAYGFNSIRLRYFNVAGALPDGSMGEDKNPFTTIVPIAIMAAMGKRQFKLNGTDYDTPDGTNIRDYIHVVDLAEAHVDALEYLASHSDVSTHYNVGVGKGYSNLEVINMIKEVSGIDFQYETGPRRLGDPAQIYADNSKIKAELGWAPVYGLREIVASAWQWHSEHPDGYESTS